MYSTFLRHQVRGASAHATSLAWLLAGYDATTLRARLQCSEQTVLWLQLFGRPLRSRWRQDVQRIANDLSVDTVLVAQLIREAEATARRAVPRPAIPR